MGNLLKNNVIYRAKWELVPGVTVYDIETTGLTEEEIKIVEESKL